MSQAPASKLMLLAESGATKTEWRLYSGREISKRFYTAGLNPSTYTDKSLGDTLEGIFSAHLKLPEIESLFFFGAGLKNLETRDRMRRILEKIPPKFGRIELYDDLYAAVLACQRETGIVAILGTGSNACYFEKGRIISRKGGMGYLLGDEGSGMDLGKTLVQHILEERLSLENQSQILEYMGVDPAELRKRVYEAEKPGLYFASLAPVVKHFEDVEELRLMVKGRLRKFLQKSVLPLSPDTKIPVDFVGSIAFHFQDLLGEAMYQENRVMGKLIPHPMELLPGILNK